MRDILGFLAGFIIICLVISGIVFVSVSIPYALFDRYLCNRLETNIETETKWDLFNGCFIKVNDRFIPQESWKGEQQWN